mgnify:CR=1 FL=1
MAVLSRSDLGILSFLANSNLVAISQECLYANHLGDALQMERDKVVRIKEDSIADTANDRTWLLLEKIITRYNSRLMSLSKTKATRRSPCYGEERLFLALLGCWLGRLFRRSLLLVGTLVELGCNHDDSGVLHAILVCPFLWLEEALDGEQRALGELVE